MVVTLSSSNEGIAQITLSSGVLIELKSNRVKLTADNTISNLRFSSDDMSPIVATLDFSVEDDGINPMISNANFDNKESNILIAKNLSRAPLTPITGTYVRIAGTGGFPTIGRTCNQNIVDDGGNGGDYFDNRYDLVYIDAGEGMTANLVFQNNANGFNLENGFDFLRIYDDNSLLSLEIKMAHTGQSAAPGGFTGTTLSGRTVASTGRYLTALFVADYSITSICFSEQIFECIK